MLAVCFSAAAVSTILGSVYGPEAVEQPARVALRTPDGSRAMLDYDPAAVVVWRDIYRRELLPVGAALDELGGSLVGDVDGNGLLTANDMLVFQAACLEGGTDMQCLFAWAAILGFAGAPQPGALDDSLDRALSRLSTLDVGDGSKALGDSIAVLRAGVTPGDYRVWESMRRIVNDANRPAEVRLRVLGVALDKADGRIARDLVKEAYEYLEGKGEGSVTDGTRLAGAIIERLPEPPWPDWIASAPQTLPLLRAAALAPWGEPDIGRAATRALALTPASLDARRSVALEIIAAHRRRVGTDPSLITLIDESSLPTLRAWVRESADPREFHWHAASVLAHVGDREILADLKARRETFAAIRPNFGAAMTGLVNQIEVQHPPERLLAYIQSLEGLDARMRPWAVERAAELGLDGSRIRGAILAHARHPTASLSRVDRARFAGGLIELKIVGLRLGVLRDGDLPEVQIPPDLEHHGQERGGG